MPSLHGVRHNGISLALNANTFVDLLRTAGWRTALIGKSHLQNMTEPCPTCHGTGRVFTAETIVRRLERSVRRMGVEGKRDHLVVKLHPDVAMYVLEHEKDLLKKLEKLAGFGLELRDDPLLRPDEFKLVVKSAGRDVTQQYAVA